MSDNSGSAQPDGDELSALLKEKYREEYRLRASQSMGLLDGFRGKEGRLKKIDERTEKMLERDLKKGVLQARAQEELAQENAQAQAAAAERANPDPDEQRGNFSFLDITGRLEQEEIPHNAQSEFRVSVPDVPKLLAATDEQFIGYVLDTVSRYDMSVPGFQMVDEIRSGAPRQPGEKPAPIYGTIIKKHFNVNAGRIDRTPEQQGVMTLFHSTAQKPFIDTAHMAIHSFNQTGIVTPHMREDFILEQVKDELRNTRYPKTKRYEEFCLDVLTHVVTQFQSMGSLMNGPVGDYQPGAYLDTRPPMVPTNVKVTFNMPKPPKA